MKPVSHRLSDPNVRFGGGCPAGVEPVSSTFTKSRAGPLHYGHHLSVAATMDGDRSIQTGCNRIVITIIQTTTANCLRSFCIDRGRDGSRTRKARFNALDRFPTGSRRQSGCPSVVMSVLVCSHWNVRFAKLKLVPNEHQDLAEVILSATSADAPIGIIPTVAFNEPRVACVKQHFCQIGMRRKFQSHALPHDGNLDHFPVFPQSHLTTSTLGTERRSRCCNSLFRSRLDSLSSLERVLDRRISESVYEDR